VWAPIAAIVLVLAGVSLPSVLKNSLGLLGQTTGAVALFASGIVLFAQKVALTRAVAAIVLARNVLIPAALWGALVALGATSQVVRESVITLAIPTASIAVILAVQYKTDEREMASSLLFSTVLSVVTMSAFILLT
jgi:malonate transporter and related proteins